MTKKTEYPGAAVRIRVMKRDRFTCTYCGASGTNSELETDHIIPVSKGGSHHISNLTTACRACNQKKSDGTLPVTTNGNGSRNQTPRDGLVGMFLHTFKDGELHYQGHIISVDGEIALVQLFEWGWGEPTIIKPMKKDFIYSSDCVLYPTNEEMISAYTKKYKKETRITV